MTRKSDFPDRAEFDASVARAKYIEGIGMPLSDAELRELIAKALAGELVMVGAKGGQTEKAVLRGLNELLQLRAAAQPHPGHTTSHFPGGDERAAARPECTTITHGPIGKGPYMVRFPTRKSAIPELYESFNEAVEVARMCAEDYGCPTYVRDSEGRTVHDVFPHPTHPAPPSLGAGDADLAPAADPANPLGSAVGGPGFKPYED